MNFLRLTIFSDFFMIFQEILEVKTAEIRRKWARIMGIMVYLSCVTWLHRKRSSPFAKWTGRISSGYSAINQCSLLWKWNF